MKDFISFFGAVGLVMALMVSTVLAEPASTYTLFGKSSITTTGHNSLGAVSMTSDVSHGYGGIDFDTEDSLTLASLTILSTDYLMREESCGNKSPRFAIGIIDPNDSHKTERTIYVLIGQKPGRECNAGTWHKSGNLLKKGKFVDATEVGGFYYEPYESVVKRFGSHTITGIRLITDAGWMFDDGQTAYADNIVINNKIYSFEPNS